VGFIRIPPVFNLCFTVTKLLEKDQAMQIKPSRIALAVSAALVAFTLQAPVAAQAVAAKVLVAPSIPVAATTGDKAVVKAATLNAPAKVSFQWFLANKAIKNATKTSLVITKTQMGKALYALETVKFKTGKIVSVKSNSIIVGRISAAAPSLGFTDNSQLQLTAAAAASVPADATVTYSWAVDGTAINNAAGTTLTVGPNHEGKKLTVSAIYTKAGYTTTTIKSAALTVPAKGAPSLNLLWQQDFNESAGSGVDSAIWNYDLGDGTDDLAGPGWGNNERQSYNTDAVKTDGNGNLVITATRVTGQTVLKCANTPCDFTSGRIQTHNKIGFKFGRLEARIKVTGGQGVWPAFWAMGAKLGDGSTFWPRAGELDIAEWRGQDVNTVNGTLHMSRSYGGSGLTSATTLSSPSSDWHTYALDWAPNRVSWLVDGVPYFTVIRDEVNAPTLWPFNDEQFILLNLAMGGNFVGSIDTSVTGATMTVDYVKYYSVNGVGELIQH
jgi:beta-glucanase (GH16 family)